MAWKITLTVFALLLAATALTGCNMAAEEATEALVEGSTGADVEIDDEGGSVSVETEDGSMEVTGGDSAEVPDGFPSDMPLYDGTVVMGQAIEVDGETSYNVAIEVEDDVADIADWYSSELDAEGWTITFEMSNDSDGMEMVTYQVEKGNMTGQVIIAHEDEETTVAVTVVPK